MSRAAARISWLPLLAAFALAAGCEERPAGGIEIRPLDPPAAAGSGQPHTAPVRGGGVVLSWMEPADGVTALKHATLTGQGAWSQPATVASGEQLFVNWADVPSIVPISGETWAAHWLRLIEGSYGAYDVAAAVSNDAGVSWSEPVLLNDDGTQTEHGFATLFEWEGDIGAVWLDGRELAQWSFDEPDALLGVSLRFARLSFDGRVLERGEIDSLACDCCQTDVAIARGGPIVIYRDRTEDEIRDVVVRRHVGGQWQPALALGAEQWRIEGCPVNGPAIDADDAEVAAAWFTAADGVGRVRFARSSDGGETFSSAVDVDADGAFGQVDVALLGDATAVVSWWRRGTDGRTALAARTVAGGGALGPIVTIAENAVAQPLDVPEMERAGDALVFAWTDAGEGGGVRAALVRNLR